eukprot:12645811-Ditylum_brightwellii.AAC.1
MEESSWPKKKRGSNFQEGLALTGVNMAIRYVLHEDPKSDSLKDLQSNHSVLIETGSCGDIMEVGTQTESEGGKGLTVDKHNESSNALINEASVS